MPQLALDLTGRLTGIHKILENTWRVFETFTNHEISMPQWQSTMDASNTRYGRAKSENVDKKMTNDIRKKKKK